MEVCDGKISIMKWTGDESYIEIRVLDDNRRVVAKVDMSLLDFADAITGTGCIDCVVKTPDKT